MKDKDNLTEVTREDWDIFMTNPDKDKKIARMKQLIPSQKIFRFRSFDGNVDRFLSEINDIKNNRITLASPDSFNDPYDCFLPIDEDKLFSFYKEYALERLREIVDRQFNCNEELFNFFKTKIQSIVGLHDFFDYFRSKNSGQWGILSKDQGDLYSKLTSSFLTVFFRNNKDDLSWDRRQLYLKLENFFKNLYWNPLSGQQLNEELYSGLANILMNEVFSGHRSDKDYLKSLQKKLRSETLVACFTTEKDSMHFWSHYANNHKGICIEYDLPDQLSYFFPVFYEDNLDIICKRIIKQGINLNHAVPLVSHKSKYWAVEREFRIVFGKLDDATIDIFLNLDNKVEEIEKVLKCLPNDESKHSLEFYKKERDNHPNIKRVDTTCIKCRKKELGFEQKNEGLVGFLTFCEDGSCRNSNKYNFKFNFGYRAIKAIYLGVDFNEKCERAKMLFKTIEEMNKIENIKIYKMELGNHSFKMIAKELSKEDFELLLSSS